ncbi:hypothetical protein U9M48_028759 [Paspalum notatum var. saurae]|uniref:Uncharacterized protein n=1 Tax=Paspalum notatum var. saurae TaxID=547442 RepID=A0AAQ3X0J1_PASNO
MATHPGDPHSRPRHVDYAVSANREIELEQDSLVGKAIVCSHDGHNHDSDPKHVIDALSEKLESRGARRRC